MNVERNNLPQGAYGWTDESSMVFIPSGELILQLMMDSVAGSRLFLSEGRVIWVTDRVLEWMRVGKVD